MATAYLISPPYQNVYSKINTKNFGVLQPPLGLAYIASYIQSQGHTVKLFDASFTQDIFADIHALTEDVEVYERKYGILSETFYELYTGGIEPDNDTWVLDWTDWAGAY